jgi:tRNA(Ile)-lysidine synthase
MEEFNQLFEKLGPYEESPKLAVAVSGGSDSLALTLSLHQWVKSKNGSLYALTIDHQLRSQSAEESLVVHNWLKSHNIHHTIIKAHILSKNNLASEARQERYKLLTEWCQDNNILHLFVAHTLDDQAENFVIRASRGSGLDGLSHIKYISYKNKVRVLRPFLQISKASLQKFLLSQNHHWIEDPTNVDQDYLRVRARNFLNSNYIEEASLMKTRLKNAALHIYEVNQVIYNLVYKFFTSNVKFFPEGYIRVQYNSFLALEKPVALKILAKALIAIGGLEYTPRLQTLYNIYESLSNITSSGPNTFCHCQILKEFKNNAFYIISESRPFPLSVQNKQFTWRNKLLIQLTDRLLKAYSNKLFINTLKQGDKEILKIASNHFVIKKLPKSILFSIPALYLEDQVIAIPHLDYYRPPFNKEDISIKLVVSTKI